MNTPLIRPLQKTDAEAFVQLRTEALLDSPFSFGSSPGYDRASADFVHKAVADPNAAIFGAFQPALVGTAGIYRDVSPKTGHHAHIWGVYVRPTHRGKGLGRA